MAKILTDPYHKEYILTEEELKGLLVTNNRFSAVLASNLDSIDPHNLIEENYLEHLGAPSMESLAERDLLLYKRKKTDMETNTVKTELNSFEAFYLWCDYHKYKPYKFEVLLKYVTKYNI